MKKKDKKDIKFFMMGELWTLKFMEYHFLEGFNCYGSTQWEDRIIKIADSYGHMWWDTLLHELFEAASNYEKATYTNKEYEEVDEWDNISMFVMKHSQMNTVMVKVAQALLHIIPQLDKSKREFVVDGGRVLLAECLKSAGEDA